MDEELVETDVPTVGERLKAARESQKMNLEDIAAQTRIPQRHLESIETANWAALPAPTYTVGFAKSYASAVGLDRTEIGEQLREEMGGQRFTPTAASEVFEPADPARTMPKWLVLGAIAAVIAIVLLMSWLSHRSLNQPDDQANVAAAPSAPAPLAAPPAAAAQGPVVVTASEPVWLSIYDKAGTKYFEGTLAPGQSFTVPANAAAPLLKTGKPEGLSIKVGSAVAPSVGPPATTVSDVSLLPANLLKGPTTAAAQVVPPPIPAPGPGQRATRARPAPPPPSPPVVATPTPANTTG